MDELDWEISRVSDGKQQRAKNKFYVACFQTVRNMQGDFVSRSVLFRRPYLYLCSGSKI